MEPQYTNEAFLVVVLKDGTRIVRPVAMFDGTGFALTTLRSEGYDVAGASIQTVKGRWWARLVEPGMIDATAWEGPFPTRSEAQSHLEG